MQIVFYFKTNISTISKSKSCAGLNLQIVFTLPIVEQSSPAVRVTKVQKFRKKDFLRQKNDLGL